MGTSEPYQRGASLNEVLAELEKYECLLLKSSACMGAIQVDPLPLMSFSRPPDVTHVMNETIYGWDIIYSSAFNVLIIYRWNCSGLDQ